MVKGYLKRHASESQLQNFSVEHFYDKVIDAIKSALSSQIQSSADFLMSQIEKVPFARISVLLYNYKDRQAPLLELTMSNIFVFYLSKEMENRCQDKVLLRFHMLESCSSNDDLLLGALQLVTVKSMCSNLMRPPVLVEGEKKTIHEISTPSSKEPNIEAIVFIGIILKSIT